MIKVNSTEQDVIAWQTFIKRYAPSYAVRFDGTPLKIDGYFGNDDLSVHQEWQRRKKRPVTNNISDDELQIMGLLKGPQTTAKERHLAVVHRGTGGIIGLDYVSRVCQANAHLVEERNPHWSATMGGLPVGAAGNINDPSMWNGVKIAVDAAKVEIRSALQINPKRRVVLGGYSAGACVTAILVEWMKAEYPDNYLCSFSFGDPTRPFGGSYFLGPILAGEGISSTHYGDPKDYRHCWLTDPDDMYGNVPLGDTGEIMHTAYDMVTQVELSNIIDTTKRLIPLIMEIMEEAGIELPAVLAGLGGGIPGLISFGLPILIGMLPGLIAGIGGNTADLTGPAAAAQAAIIALKFMASQPPTAPHIQYEFRQVWPGQTYLGLASQHVRDWSMRAMEGKA